MSQAEQMRAVEQAVMDEINAMESEGIMVANRRVLDVQAVSGGDGGSFSPTVYVNLCAPFKGAAESPWTVEPGHEVEAESRIEKAIQRVLEIDGV